MQARYPKTPMLVAMQHVGLIAIGHLPQDHRTGHRNSFTVEDLAGQRSRRPLGDLWILRVHCQRQQRQSYHGN
jgi:hypothetical protein